MLAKNAIRARVGGEGSFSQASEIISLSLLLFLHLYFSIEYFQKP